VWHAGKPNPKGGLNVEPNNWVSVFYGSAWTWSEKRQEYYLHQFTKQQPDLNYRNPKVVERMSGVLTFWLEKGVSGFRVDAVSVFSDKQKFRTYFFICRLIIFLKWKI
jgi:alpha-glucosidase